MFLYGEEQEVEILAQEMLWGEGWYHKLLFVLCKMKDGRKIILATDRLTMKPAEVVEAYGRRFGCESGFKVYKELFKGMKYHFWTKSMDHMSHFRSADMPHILEGITDEHRRKKILEAIKASEVYMQCACIAQGISQLISMDQPVGGEVQKATRKRTYTERKVSEKDICNYITKHSGVFFEKYADNELIKFIVERGEPVNAVWDIL